MLAALMSLGIFAFCTVVGLGLVCLLAREDRPYLPLLAPTLGAAVLGIPTVWLNVSGIPIGRFGPWLLSFALAAALCALVYARRRISLARYWPFIPILLAGFVLAGRPFFEFGFNWLSYSNDDMANYVLTAHRILVYGFYTAPASTYYSFNRDPTLVYWLWAVVNERFGAEAFVSLWLSVVRLNGFQLFMPIMVALGLMQITAGAALVYRSERYRPAAILTACLLAVSALSTFGIEYQLIAQVFGLPLMAASTLLILDVPRNLDFRSVLLATVATTSLAMVYPEITPFLVLGIGFYVGARLFRRSLTWRTAAIWLGSVGALTLVFLNLYLRNFLTVMEARVVQSAAPENLKYFIELFPFYLIPSGVPNLFGIYSSVQNVPEPWLSLGILAGLLLLVITAFSAVEGTFAAEPAGAPALIMFGLAILLFFKHQGFGLFKIAMYLQPFIIPCLVLWWLRLSHFAPESAAAE